MHLVELPTPALLLDVETLEANLERMAQRALRFGVALRPHVKTHKCLEVARRQRAMGAAGLTVATLAEARVFAEAGFDDITWALPVSLARLDEALELARRVTLRLLVDSREAVAALESSGHPFRVWLKVDCGYHRAGVDPGDPGSLELARWLHLAQGLRFDGLLTHAGHAYACRSPEALRAVAAEERGVTVSFAERLRGQGIEVRAVSVGSTPTMSVVEDLTGVSEMRPGNYAFYDLTQVHLGSCSLADCALSVLSSVVSCQPRARHSVIDAGALALSKDPGPAWLTPTCMGRIYEGLSTAHLRQDCRVVSLSQEHGIVDAPLPLGSRLRIAPNHSCLTAAQFDAYHVVRGEEVIDQWRIWRER